MREQLSILCSSKQIDSPVLLIIFVLVNTGSSGLLLEHGGGSVMMPEADCSSFLQVESRGGAEEAAGAERATGESGAAGGGGEGEAGGGEEDQRGGGETAEGAETEGHAGGAEQSGQSSSAQSIFAFIFFMNQQLQS